MTRPWPILYSRRVTDLEIYKESAHLLDTPDPHTLLEYIDRIRELRAQADVPFDDDPCGHRAEMVRVFRAEAKILERYMHRRLGWTPGGLS